LSVSERFRAGDVVGLALVSGFGQRTFGDGRNITNIDDTDFGVSGRGE